MATLKTDYKDYTFTENKKFKIITNADGTVSFEDVTEYTVVGDDFGSDDINKTNKLVNEMKELIDSGIVADYDSMPVGTVIEYEGDTIPDGYEEYNEINNPNLLLTDKDIITFTPDVGSYHEPYGGCFYYKIGTRVHLHIGIQGLTAKTNNEIFTLPVGFRPKVRTPFISIDTGLADECAGLIRDTGEIVIYAEYGFASADVEYDAFN